MKTYWDYTEQARAQMTEQDVTDLLDLELMEKGVLKVIPPKLEGLTPVVLPKDRVYSIRYRGEYGSGTELDVVFASAESAEKFLKLEGLVGVRCSRYGTEPHIAPMVDASICPEDLPSKATVEAKESVLRENTAREQRNQQAKAEFAKAIAKVDAATSQIWNDWRACRSKRDRMKKIEDTRAEYLKLTEGNAATAERFLAKVFTEEDLREEAEWSGRSAS